MQLRLLFSGYVAQGPSFFSYQTYFKIWANPSLFFINFSFSHQVDSPSGIELGLFGPESAALSIGPPPPRSFSNQTQLREIRMRIWRNYSCISSTILWDCLLNCKKEKKLCFILTVRFVNFWGFYSTLKILTWAIVFYYHSKDAELW